jgi:phage-related protein
MPTIKDKLHFNFNGVWSNTYGLINVALDSGMFEETLVASREIVETKIRGNDRPMLHRIEYSPLEFDMTIAFENGYEDEDIDSIIRWLFVKQYKSLYFQGKENRVYMCLPVGDPMIVHNGLNEGYFTIRMRCDSPNVYSPYLTTDLEIVTTSSTVTINNDGHDEGDLEISIKKDGVGQITIECLDDGGSIFDILNLTNLEDVYINCNREIIETDLIGESRYDDVVGDFPRLIMGVNRFKITGSCQIQFRYKNKYRI